MILYRERSGFCLRLKRLENERFQKIGGLYG
ncbi:hypothetical protein [Pseudomonas tussilaginis]